MYFAHVLRNALLALVPVSVLLTTYLYYFPFFHRCAFPAPDHGGPSAYQNTLRKHAPFSKHDPTAVAPFRLLALGDPQLEGESPYFDPDAPIFPSLNKFWRDVFLLDGVRHNPLQRLRHSLHDLVDFYLEDIPDFIELYRKRVDHIGNDYYLGHIYKTIHWWSDPTHVTTLGDLVGSQWIANDEFESRGWRYWNRVFRGGERVADELATQPSADFDAYITLGDDAAGWKNRIINVAGNHDVGYAGDLSQDRMDRFDRVFGKPNYELRFQLPINRTWTSADAVNHDKFPTPEIRIIVLNDMNLDTPASSKELQTETYQFLNQIITHSKDVSQAAHFTLLLTHIPMYKKDGVCVDGPFFDFFGEDFSFGVKEQNHLSPPASKGFTEGIFGMNADSSVPGKGLGRKGLILTGHDHEGCDTYHYINQTAPPQQEWQAMRWREAEVARMEEKPAMPGLREITVRSMMGSYNGNAGLLSLWFDEEAWDWKFEFTTCGLGTQHIWWLVHILDLVTFGVLLVYIAVVAVEFYLPPVPEKPAPIMEQINTGRRRLTISGTMSPMGLMSPISPLSASPFSPIIDNPKFGEAFLGRMQRSHTLATPQGAGKMRRQRSRSTLGGVPEVNSRPTTPTPPGMERFPDL
jgi:hypothetical protein